MQCKIYFALQAEQATGTAQVGDSIVSELAGGNAHEVFHHLKGWYCSATETQARPCYQTLENQTNMHINFYR
jgi:hypothetical protein